VALPVFHELMLKIYRDKLAGPPPSFPPQMEQRITEYLQGDARAVVVDAAPSGRATDAPRGHASPAESEGLLHHATASAEPIPTTKSSSVPLNPIRDR
jgi:hypothetical protein